MDKSYRTMFEDDRSYHLLIFLGLIGTFFTGVFGMILVLIGLEKLKDYNTNYRQARKFIALKCLIGGFLSISVSGLLGSLSGNYSVVIGSVIVSAGLLILLAIFDIKFYKYLLFGFERYGPKNRIFDYLIYVQIAFYSLLIASICCMHVPVLSVVLWLLFTFSAIIYFIYQILVIIYCWRIRKM